MEIIYELKYNNQDCIRLFTSNASARKANLRIHYHSLIEISLVLDGNGIYKIGNKFHDIKKDNVFFFRPNEAHCITDIEKEGMTLLNLHIAPYYLYTNFQGAFNSNYLKILSSNFPLLSNKINDTLGESEVEKVKRLILSVKSEFENKKSDYLTLANNYISSILILFSRSYVNTTFTKKERQNYQKLLKTIEFIDLHFKEDLTLENLANNVGYTRCYFSTIFKKCMGMSIWDYVLIKRIEEALALIKTTDKNILDIALECGFNNTVNFNKIFKKYTNLLPSSFRK